ncbi:MAG: sugar phosphate isomerase/epimerase [Clostridia bacterium]|nr:sugar phosphate isomerase/epimerase [Clostridia bacterium]
MNFSVSSLSFPAPRAFEMAKLDKSLGIEIFYEWAGKTLWEKSLEAAMEGREGPFSIHAPFMCFDLSVERDMPWLEAYLAEAFDIYHRFDADGYVLHTNAPIISPLDERVADDRRKLVAERLHRLNEICAREGIAMLVENLGFGAGRKTLFNFEQYMKLFIDDETLLALYDTGHGNLEGYDIEQMQKTLGDRLRGYHLHDNGGKTDDHQRVFTGTIDWRSLMNGAVRYTPNANMVMEYNESAVDGMSNYIDDAKSLMALIEQRGFGEMA